MKKTTVTFLRDRVSCLDDGVSSPQRVSVCEQHQIIFEVVVDDAGDVVVVVDDVDEDGVREEVDEDDVREEDLLGIQFVKYVWTIWEPPARRK